MAQTVKANESHGHTCVLNKLMHGPMGGGCVASLRRGLDLRAAQQINTHLGKWPLINPYAGVLAYK